MADEFKRRGNDAFKANKFQEAIEWYGKAIEKEPGNETLYSNRAASYSSLNMHQQALADSEQCIKIKPSWIKGHFRKGVALSKLGRLNEAATAFEAALKLEPNNLDVQHKLNEARATLKKQVGSAEPSRERDPNKCKELGNANFKEGKYEDAIGWYTRAIELTEDNNNPNPETAVYYCNRAACHQQTHAFKNVIADCANAIHINPNFSKAYMRRALAYEGIEKWAKAADDYKKVMALDPGATAASTGYHRCSKFAKDAI